MATKKRFLFTTTAGYGHFHPLVPLAQMLNEAGHEVAFAAPPSLSKTISAAGFRFFAVDGNHKQDPEYQQVRPELHKLPLGLETEKLIYAKIFCGINPRLAVPDLLEVARSWKPDGFIRESAEYGGFIVAKLLALPCVEVNPLASLMGLFTFEQEGYVNLNFIGQKFGLVSNFSFETLHSGRVITFAPPSFCMHSLREPYPVSPYFVRPQFFDQSGNEVLPEWVAKLPDLPTVYVTLGTEANDTPGVLQTIIDGLRDEPINLIATVGRNQNPADFGEQPPNVHIERYIPQSLLLPYCNLTVMHGGSNSLLQAVSAGLPLVIVPLIADQFFNADIVESLGLGQIVKLAQLNPDNVRSAVREGLNNPVYRHNIKRLRNEMQSLPELKSLQSVFNLLY